MPLETVEVVDEDAAASSVVELGKKEASKTSPPACCNSKSPNLSRRMSSLGSRIRVAEEEEDGDDDLDDEKEAARERDRDDDRDRDVGRLVEVEVEVEVAGRLVRGATLEVESWDANEEDISIGSAWRCNGAALTSS